MIKIDYNYGQASVRVLIGLVITVISALRDWPLSLSLSCQSVNCKLVRNWFATDSIELCMRPQGTNMDAWAF